MLADDMVSDGEQRRSYLHTLQTEATRLTHLVENVLAYSRIERGSARVRIEETTVEELANRIVPRLEERTCADGMKITLDMPEDMTGVRLRADLTAAEQILFNLVDNACKYAAPPSGDGLLRDLIPPSGTTSSNPRCRPGPRHFSARTQALVKTVPQIRAGSSRLKTGGRPRPFLVPPPRPSAGRESRVGAW